MLYPGQKLPQEEVERLERAKILGRLRKLHRQGASVKWAGRRWFIGWYGLEPADRKWGDLTWKELGVERMGEVLRKVAQERVGGSGQGAEGVGGTK